MWVQVTKGIRWMPWHEEATKDVVSCDKPRGVAKQTLSPGDFRMGKPDGRHGPSSAAEYIGRVKRTGGSETSQYPQEEKSIEIPLVVASERGRAQTFGRNTGRVVGLLQGLPEK